MEEIGDVRRFERKQSLVAFAGVDAPPCQSGTFESKNRHISKRGSPRLRKTLFQVMSTIIQHSPADDPVFQFLDRKMKEGKHYYVYMTAAANKFLRIYYGTVTAYLARRKLVQRRVNFAAAVAAAVPDGRPGSVSLRQRVLRGQTPEALTRDISLPRLDICIAAAVRDGAALQSACVEQNFSSAV